MISKPNEHSPGRMLILPLVFLLTVTLSSILAIVLYSIVQVNEDSRKSSENYVAAIIKDKLSQQAILTKDYAYWDATIKNAYYTQNPKWIDENIGSYLTNTFKVTDLFIIDKHNKAVLSLRDGQLDKSNFQNIDKISLTSLILEARKSGAIPVPVSGIVMINDHPAIVGAAVLTPENGAVLTRPRPILLIAKQLKMHLLLEISEQYRLKDLQFSSGEPENTSNAFIDITNPQGKVLGNLSWQSDKPGSLMLSKIKFPLLILLISAGIITYIIIRAALTTTQRLKDAYDNMTHLANHDSLTGLPNRRLLDEFLDQTIHSAKRDNTHSAMLYLDLDDFKQVNDTFGHHEGDRLLIIVAERLIQSIRESDTIARIGGDEFIILLRNTRKLSDVKATVHKIQASIAEPIKLSKNEVKISTSIGITMIPKDGIDPDILMKNSDLALYECKKRGRNTFKFYDPPT